ncbi:MAG: AAA family ATPase [Chloroflexi bacterium]|nr:AAA family ATPase [Chloroflexota bacterium]MBI1856034.1 AAA family ATPase [Chloroflexota bacterium]MBI3341019.1 AAA family ATPase [Chloroflexota bacterium]
MTKTTLKELTEKAKVASKHEESNPAAEKRTTKKDRKPNSDEMKQGLDIYLRGLPPELRTRFERFNQLVITEAVNADQADPTLDNLLPEIKTIDAATILKTEYPPIDWTVQDYLAPGLTFLVGKPKVGKSWLALQLALSVLTGGKMFDKDVKAGRVLILALEDNARRLNDRMKMQGWHVKPGSVDFMMADDFRDQIKALNAGGGKRLLNFIEKKKYRLVIVDTFSRAIQGDQLDPGQMTESVGPLQQHALSKGVALVIVDHMPKNSPSQSPIDHVYGSVAKAGITDALWGLYKEQGKAGAKIAVTGRDVAETELKLMFDTRGFYWHCEGNALDVEMTMQRKKILDVLNDIGKAQLKDIAKAAGQHESHCHTRLQDLVNAGKVRRIANAQTSNIFYELPSELQGYSTSHASDEHKKC